jgi:uncharacterized membrane protein YfcA
LLLLTALSLGAAAGVGALLLTTLPARALEAHVLQNVIYITLLLLFDDQQG